MQQTRQKKQINKSIELLGEREGRRRFLTLFWQGFLLAALQADCVVWVSTALDLKSDRQVMLQKSFIVPLTSTAAMMRS